MAILHLMRHAKSDWDHPNLVDHDRPLAARGERAASLIGAYMEQEGVEPDLILCSSARRTQETLERILPYLPDGTEVRIEPKLYAASVTQMLALAAAAGEGVDQVLLIGHNPGTQYVAMQLAGSGDPGSLQELRTKYPTAALTSIELPGPLSELMSPEGAAGELLRFITPKSLV